MHDPFPSLDYYFRPCTKYNEIWRNTKNIFRKSLAFFAIFGYNESMKIFAERLNELRKERGLSQATVARDLGISLGIICYWETNKSDPTAGNIAKLAHYFNVTSDFLLGLSD